MSKKRHKNRQDLSGRSNANNNTNPANNNRQQQMNFTNPFGINPNQLLSMFGNIDMNQINSMLQSMGTEGFDFNNFNLGSIQNLMNGMVRMPNNQQNNQNFQQSQANRTKNMQKENVNSGKSDSHQNIDSYSYDDDDDNIQMLNSLRNIVGENRREFIDKIIKLYNEGAFED